MFSAPRTRPKIWRAPWKWASTISRRTTPGGCWKFWSGEPRRNHECNESKRGTMSVRTGILGVGFMGRVHAGILRRDRRVELSGVFDVDRQRGEEAAKELNCTLARTEEELFERSDAIYITVPNTLH